ncbi:MAG: cysteine synthase A [Candidatus Eisenbacteria bacterium]|nr:cysteine synthase A [Candidatus Eisenbacteria bacterium]
MIHDTVLSTIGGTPLVRIRGLTRDGDAEVVAKLESFNPGGSVKDRAALGMIEDAERRGTLSPGDTIVEPTSGNTGVGLAMVAAVKGYRTIFTMPDSMSEERRALLRQLGATVILTPGGYGMSGAVAEAERISERPGHFMPRQFSNPANPGAHRRSTGPEIVDALGDRIPDYFVAGVGTGGTISGAGGVLKKRYPDLKVIAVEPSASPVLSGGSPGPHCIQGLGAGFVPENFNASVVDEILAVDDQDALDTARRLAREEGVLAGISSGAAMFAALTIARRAGREGLVIVVLPDTGERYISTELFRQGA